ncbi:hypothetical protein BKK79_27955 [Cupriavidus sp. USMAA2-4]|uniref:DUF4279 domain-containing protein n=1 Tax=Cupriavidus sp. USMAA2-4 TaxID=876364 RepID=UPI0008A70E69|nr:DUF4279 domain-containing protein [Cupriavidus sp. USMAA2-4]AOY95573.1 hypothetical protein BKK79_27955 [Cupriavidus sp. USMAA2-4]
MMKDEPMLIIALYVTGTKLDPDRITEILGIEPNRKRSCGEKRISSSGHEITAKCGLWGLVIESDSPLLEVQLAQLVEKVRPSQTFPTVAGVEEAYVDVFIALGSDSDGNANCDLSLSADLLTQVARLGLPLKITVSVGRD